MGRKVSDGLSVRVTVPAGSTSMQGDIGLFDGFCGFNLTREKADPTYAEPVVLQIEQGEYEVSPNQVGAAPFATVGGAVYYDPATNTVNETTGRFIGQVTVAKDASGAIWMHLAAQGALAPTP